MGSHVVSDYEAGGWRLGQEADPTGGLEGGWTQKAKWTWVGRCPPRSRGLHHYGRWSCGQSVEASGMCGSLNNGTQLCLHHNLWDPLVSFCGKRSSAPVLRISGPTVLMGRTQDEAEVIMETREWSQGLPVTARRWERRMTEWILP
jgi:hypothetical protein